MTVTPPLTVAALAVADGPADAVGVVQLACEEASLALTLLRAGAYRRDFVPGSLAEAVTVHVPYSAVRGLVRRSRALVLTLDRSVPTPFHRLALASWPRLDGRLKANVLPTWFDVVRALYPAMARDDIRLWLERGRTASTYSLDRRWPGGRVPRWQADVPDDWRSTIKDTPTRRR